MSALTTFERMIEDDRTSNVSRGTGLCWSKYGVEAGQSVDVILARKEAERLANGGVFFWGIGSNVQQALRALTRVQRHVDVWFSAMRSRPKRQDQAPDRVVVWNSGETLDGRSFKLPLGSVVTSRASRSRHFALVCASEEPLRETSLQVNSGEFENWVSGARVGHSQVTSIVRLRSDSGSEGALYERGFRATLAAPFLISLTHGFEVPGEVFAASVDFAMHLELRDLSFASGIPVDARRSGRSLGAQPMFDPDTW